MFMLNKISESESESDMLYNFQISFNYKQPDK